MNLINTLITWQNGLMLICGIACMFMFWQINHGGLSDGFYKLINRMFFGSVLAYLLMHAIGYYNVIWLTVLWVGIVYISPTSDHDRWSLLDNLVLPIALFLLTDRAVGLLTVNNNVKLISLILILVYLLILLPWIKRNYRTLSWYPSGKPGFIFYTSVIYFIIIGLLIDFYERPALYWPKLILLLLFIVSIRTWLGKLTFKIKLLKNS